jgi:hypothetical protein
MANKKRNKKMKEFKFKTGHITYNNECTNGQFVTTFEADAEIRDYINSIAINFKLKNPIFSGRIDGIYTFLRNGEILVAGTVNKDELIDVFDIDETDTFENSKDMVFKKEVNNIIKAFDNVFNEIKKGIKQ